VLDLGICYHSTGPTLYSTGITCKIVIAYQRGVSERYKVQLGEDAVRNLLHAPLYVLKI